MATNYTLEGNVLMNKREIASMVRNYLQEHNQAPSKGELIEWAVEEVSITYLSDVELAEGLAADRGGMILYAHVDADDIAHDLSTRVRDVLENAYRQEMEAQVIAWVVTLWDDLVEAEDLILYECADCVEYSEEEGNCPICGDPMALDWEEYLDLDALFAQDLEAEGLD